MNDELPGGIKARLGGLSLPEFQIKRAIQILDPPATFHKLLFHLAATIISLSGKRRSVVAGRLNGVRLNWWSYIADVTNTEFDAC
jgi:hypothetical protein